MPALPRIRCTSVERAGRCKLPGRSSREDPLPASPMSRTSAVPPRRTPAFTPPVDARSTPAARPLHHRRPSERLQLSADADVSRSHVLAHGLRAGDRQARTRDIRFARATASGTTSLVTSPLRLSTRRGPLAIGLASWSPPLVSKTTRRYEARSSRAWWRSTLGCAESSVASTAAMASSKVTASLRAVAAPNAAGTERYSSAAPPPAKPSFALSRCVFCWKGSDDPAAGGA